MGKKGKFSKTSAEDAVPSVKRRPQEYIRSSVKRKNAKENITYFGMGMRYASQQIHREGGKEDGSIALHENAQNTQSRLAQVHGEGHVCEDQ